MKQFTVEIARSRPEISVTHLFVISIIIEIRLSFLAIAKPHK